MNIRIAKAEDNQQLCAIMEQAPMGDTVGLVFERSPDYFAGAAVQSEDIEVYVLEKAGRIEGLFSIGVRRVYLYGKKQSIRYLCDLRLDRKVRGGMHLARLYQYAKQHLVNGGEIMQSLILEDNKEAMELLTSHRSFLPYYTENSRYVTHILSAKKSKQRFLKSRSAKKTDISRLQAFYDAQAAQYQFAPVLCFSELETSPHYQGLELSDFYLLEEEGEILAMAAIWNQSAFKRIKVVSYASWFRFIRPVINPFLSIPLPREGVHLGANYLFSFYVKDNAPELADMLLNDVLHRIPTQELLFVGMDEDDPLNPVLQRHTGRREYGKHYIVCYDDAMQVSGVTKFEIARI